MNTTRFSKFLSLVLRHDPGRIHLTLDAEGWAEVDELLDRLASSGKAVTREQLEQVVDTNNKQRFWFSDDGLRIRANQGHSIDIDLGLAAVEPPAALFHGTATRYVDVIRAQGLAPRSRQHVHLSVDQETAVAVGNRHGKPFVFTVRSGAMHAAGHAFFLSENGVWLTEHVPPEFLEATDD